MGSAFLHPPSTSKSVSVVHPSVCRSLSLQVCVPGSAAPRGDWSVCDACLILSERSFCPRLLTLSAASTVDFGLEASLLHCCVYLAVCASCFSLSCSQRWVVYPGSRQKRGAGPRMAEQSHPLPGRRHVWRGRPVRDDLRAAPRSVGALEFRVQSAAFHGLRCCPLAGVAVLGVCALTPPNSQHFSACSFDRCHWFPDFCCSLGAAPCRACLPLSGCP